MYFESNRLKQVIRDPVCHDHTRQCLRYGLGGAVPGHRCRLYHQLSWVGAHSGGGLARREPVFRVERFAVRRPLHPRSRLEAHRVPLRLCDIGLEHLRRCGRRQLLARGARRRNYGHESNVFATGAPRAARAFGQDGQDDPSLRLLAGAHQLDHRQHFCAVLVQRLALGDPDDGRPLLTRHARAVHQRCVGARKHAERGVWSLRQLFSIDDHDVRAHARKLAVSLLAPCQQRQRMVRYLRPGLQIDRWVRDPCRHYWRFSARDVQSRIHR
mmetsp:Transcript_15461/g.42541  ORF Transcript_15461/g.42541 Transcript_15461/m.42541 type:complete len:270 (-) Transcript_15461:516-1325(-)